MLTICRQEGAESTAAATLPLRRLIRRIVVALAGLLSVFALGAGYAGASAPTLDGETFGVTFVTYSPWTAFESASAYGTCNADGSGTLNVGAIGTATGPYPGAVYANGTVTLGPRSAGPGSRAPVTAFTGGFTVYSGATTIDGTVTLGAGADMASFGALLGGFDFRNEGDCGVASLEAFNARFGAGISYSAAFTTFAGDPYAMSSARNMVSQVESCYTDAEDYRLCTAPGNTGLTYGSGDGDVEVTASTYESYTIVAHSRSGVDFTITKGANGATTRTCAPWGQGTCLADGSWGTSTEPYITSTDSDSGVGAFALRSGFYPDPDPGFLAVGFKANTAPSCNGGEFALLAGQTLQLQCSDPDTAQTPTYSAVSAPVHGSLSSAGVYTPDSGYLGFDTFTYKANDGALDSQVVTAKVLMAQLSQPVTAGVPVSTAADATIAEPVATTVTSPSGGTVAITALPVAGTPPAGYLVFGQEIDIVAPGATTQDPLEIVFRVASGSGIDPNALVILRNGNPVPRCASAPAPSPTCMVFPPTEAADHDLLVTVFTTEASQWLVTVPIAALNSAFQSPIDGAGVINKVKVGRVVPVKLALSVGGKPITYGDVRLASLTAMTCSGAVEDPVEVYSAGQANFGTSFRFDSGTWIYNLSTSGLTEGKCYRGRVTVNGALATTFSLTAAR